MQQRKRKNQRYKNRLFLYSFILLLLTALCAVIFFHLTPSPKISKLGLQHINSPYALLLEYESGKTIAGSQANEKIFPASLTKIMTAIVAIEQISDMDILLSIPDSIYPALYVSKASRAGFEPGDNATAMDLLYGALLPSGAECCLTLADYIAGSEEDFVYLMNEKAGQLGMKDTSFRNSTGLHDSQHYTTLQDLSILLQHALKNNVFYSVFTSMTHTTAPIRSHPDGLFMESTLLKSAQPLSINAGEILGAKTGFTNEAGQCLATLAEINTKKYILITAKANGKPNGRQLHIEDALHVYAQIANGI